jgi:hypothetical protein
MVWQPVLFRQLKTGYAVPVRIMVRILRYRGAAKRRRSTCAAPIAAQLSVSWVEQMHPLLLSLAEQRRGAMRRAAGRKTDVRQKIRFATARPMSFSASSLIWWRRAPPFLLISGSRRRDRCRQHSLLQLASARWRTSSGACATRISRASQVRLRTDIPTMAEKPTGIAMCSGTQDASARNRYLMPGILYIKLAERGRLARSVAWRVRLTIPAIAVSTSL